MKFTDFLGNGGGWVVFIVGVVAIVFAMIGFYGQHGFDWRWFVFFHLPLYIFCAWALYVTMRTYRKTLKDIEDRRRKENDEH